MKHALGLIGVPSSAGAHWPGQEKAPRFLRDAGLVKRLEDAGLRITDYGDLPLVSFRPDREHRHQQNLAAVVDVVGQVADRVDQAIQGNAVPLVIGGDCTIGLGVICGFLRHGEDICLLYFDGHVDLNTPTTTSSGILDSMGIAHLVGETGAAPELSHAGKQYPLMPEENVVLFGYNPREMSAPEREVLARRRFARFPLSDVQGRAARAASTAREYLEEHATRFVLHFDVDVIDFTDLPVANVPQFGQGLAFVDAIACLSVFASSPGFCGLTITEFNPDHAGADRFVAGRFIKGLAQALSRREPTQLKGASIDRATSASPTVPDN